MTAESEDIMATTVKGITYHLADDCDTLLCKLENAAFDAFMQNDYERHERLEKAHDKFETAINNNDKKTMQMMLNEYHAMFKRYRER